MNEYSILSCYQLVFIQKQDVLYKWYAELIFSKKAIACILVTSAERFEEKDIRTMPQLKDRVCL